MSTMGLVQVPVTVPWLLITRRHPAGLTSGNAPRALAGTLPRTTQPPGKIDSAVVSPIPPGHGFDAGSDPIVAKRADRANRGHLDDRPAGPLHIFPTSVGRLIKGDTLVSNLNDKATIMATCQREEGLTSTEALDGRPRIASSETSHYFANVTLNC